MIEDYLFSFAKYKKLYSYLQLSMILVKLTIKKQIFNETSLTLH